jgi:hypothetical protein
MRCVCWHDVASHACAPHLSLRVAPVVSSDRRQETRLPELPVQLWHPALLLLPLLLQRQDQHHRLPCRGSMLPKRHPSRH